MTQGAISQPPTHKFTMPRLFQAIRGVQGADWSREILAGVTLAALAIPLNIGYAQVAGLPPLVRIYTAIVPMIVCPLLCPSRHLVASPDAPVALTPPNWSARVCGIACQFI